MRKKPIAFKSVHFIQKYLEPLKKNGKKITAFFKMVYDGQCYAGNSKRKTNTRVSIIIPKEIANDNLKFLNNWIFYIVGVKLE